jgi:hypothetical protein
MRVADCDLLTTDDRTKTRSALRAKLLESITIIKLDRYDSASFRSGADDLASRIEFRLKARRSGNPKPSQIGGAHLSQRSANDSHCQNLPNGAECVP